MSNWLFLRGEWDGRSGKSIKDDDCVWLQLFNEIDYHGTVWFKPDTKINRYISDKNILISNLSLLKDLNKPTHIFARGGFGYYLPILKTFPDAYKVRYGAGRRFMPEPEIDYQLILVDTEAQKQAVLEKYPGSNVHLLIKPAARHFKPIECEKEYDVCYIANEQQRAFKGIDWVYETAPKDLKILHLGYHDTLNPPDNITCKRVDRIDMPKWINKCKIGIVPYGNIDSCPRALVEMIACGLPVKVLNSVNIARGLYSEGEGFFRVCGKTDLWLHVKEGTVRQSDIKYQQFTNSFLGNNFYKNNLSIPMAAQRIKDLIGE